MPKVKKLESNKKLLLLEKELRELHLKERFYYSSSGRILPKSSNLEGFDKQELYDKYGHC